MPYVQRDETGKVIGQFANLQPGFAEEFLEDSSIELLPTNEDRVLELKVELETMEQKAIMPRGAREAFIVLCMQQGTIAGLTEPQLYAANPFYKGLKDTDTAAAAIRAQIRALTP
jgi:hypothetical protein